MSIRLFAMELRKQGFVKTDQYSRGENQTATFIKGVDSQRTLEVQLWGDGRHRVSHFIDGCMTTHPTDFVTVNGMNDAIRHESTRKDNSYL